MAKAAAEKLEMFGVVHMQLKQRRVPRVQSSVAMVDHLLGSSSY